MFAFARGCTGQISGIWTATSRNSETASRIADGVSTLDGRCSVTTPNPAVPCRKSAAIPAVASVVAGGVARLRWNSSESIMTLPTKRIRSGAIPSRARLSAAARSVVKSRSAIWSVRMRLISSGMSRSKLRRPASTWTTGTPFLMATRLHASVELTSPTTTMQLGRISSSTGSKRRMISAVCTACVPEPTSRLTSGDGSSRSANSRSFIATS